MGFTEADATENRNTIRVGARMGGGMIKNKAMEKRIVFKGVKRVGNREELEQVPNFMEQYQRKNVAGKECHQLGCD